MSRFTEIPALALCVGSLKAGEPWVLSAVCGCACAETLEPQLRSDGVRKFCHARVLWIGYGNVE